MSSRKNASATPREMGEGSRPELSDLMFGPHYIVEVAFSSFNPIHRVVMSQWRGVDGHCTIWRSGYDGPEVVIPSRMAYFRVVRKLVELDDGYMPTPAKLAAAASLSTAKPEIAAPPARSAIAKAEGTV